MLPPNCILRFAVRLVLLVCLPVLLPLTSTAKPWRGIVPLKSTRADVERILGKPVVDSDVYDSPDGRAIVHYADGSPCEEGVPGLGNIPQDVVIEISASLPREVKFSDILVPGREYVEIHAVHTLDIDYLDQEEGVRYSTLDGMVGSITYFGSAEDQKKFSCGKYRYAAPVPPGATLRAEQTPLDSYGKISFEDSQARLDNFIIQLLNMNEEKENYRGYILVYAGRSAYEGEAQEIAECSKNYLVKIRNADPESIVAVDGGHKDELQVELYIIRKDAYPPMLLPTVSPKKVQIVKGRFKPCS